MKTQTKINKIKNFRQERESDKPMRFFFFRPEKMFFKRVITGVCVASFLLQPFSLAFARVTGKTGMNFLKIAPDVRGVAMGEAHVAAVDDIGAMAWNPAGLTKLTTGEAYFMYNHWFQGISAQYLACAVPLRKQTKTGYTKYYGTIGASINYLSIEPIDGYDAGGNPTGKLLASDIAVSMSYAYRLSRILSYGMNFKYISEKLADKNATSYAVDIGMLVSTLSNFSFGFAVQNLGTAVKFIKEEGLLPRNYKLGVAYRKDFYGQPLLIAFDAVMPNDSDVFYCAGTEYWVKDTIALRGGYRTGVDVGSGLRAGVGFKANIFKLDYAFSGFGELGNTHRVSLTVNFGRAVGTARIQKLYQKGMQAYEEGKFADAVRYFNHLLELDSQHKKALKMLQDAYEALDNKMKGVDHSKPAIIPSEEKTKQEDNSTLRFERNQRYSMTKLWK